RYFPAMDLRSGLTALASLGAQKNQVVIARWVTVDISPSQFAGTSNSGPYVYISPWYWTGSTVVSKSSWESRAISGVTSKVMDVGVKVQYAPGEGVGSYFTLPAVMRYLGCGSDTAWPGANSMVKRVVEDHSVLGMFSINPAMDAASSCHSKPMMGSAPMSV